MAGRPCMALVGMAPSPTCHWLLQSRVGVICTYTWNWWIQGAFQSSERNSFPVPNSCAGQHMWDCQSNQYWKRFQACMEILVFGVSKSKDFEAFQWVVSFYLLLFLKGILYQAKESKCFALLLSLGNDFEIAAFPSSFFLPCFLSWFCFFNSSTLECVFTENVSVKKLTFLSVDVWIVCDGRFGNTVSLI